MQLTRSSVIEVHQLSILISFYHTRGHKKLQLVSIVAITQNFRRSGLVRVRVSFFHSYRMVV